MPKTKPRSPTNLGDYRRKRTADATNEPFGEEIAAPRAQPEGTLKGAFVVHLHDATRRHYDVRLEVSGVLASFAVPRGPSLDPDEKVLAVKTEDHPIEYLDFEDVIPEGQYGAGPMIAWDRGAVEYLEGPAEDEIARGKLDLRLSGLKLRGRFAFVKLKKSDKGNEWLFFKKKDEHASKERSIQDELPRSVLSGMTVEELEGADARGRALVDEARALGAPALDDFDALSEPARSPLAAARPGEPTGAGWVYDAALEGVRVLASKDGDVVRLWTFDAGGAKEPVEAFYPEVVRSLRALPVTRLVVDGELVTFDATGHPSLPLLAKRVALFARSEGARAVTEMPAVLVATDLLAVGDADTSALPLHARRALLSKLAPALGYVRAAPPLEGELAPLVAFCKEHGIAALVAKRKAAPYPFARPEWRSVTTGVAPPHASVDHRAPEAEAALRRVVVTNRDKVFWPDEGYTKGDLVSYYGAIERAILPYLAQRPVILVRYPDGIAGKSFYQWNVPAGMPPWVRTMSIDEGEEHKRGFLVDDPSTLLYLANLACIPLHVLACRVPDLSRADFFTIDFDVKQSELRHAVTLATTLRELLDAAGLPGFPKTSGQSGLHVLVPLGAPADAPAQSFETARALADLLGRMLVERHPDIATMERIVSRRGPKVYVDTGQTGATRAIVAPYSVRAVAGATVSTPLTWDEVTPDLDPRAFTMKTVPARVAERGDPMAELLSIRPDVAAAVAKLAALVGREP